jgi:hypothetical protein
MIVSQTESQYRHFDLMSHFYQHSLLITLNAIKIYFRHNYCRIRCIQVGISIECCLEKISEREAGKKN